jgi:hypothetical protein
MSSNVKLTIGLVPGSRNGAVRKCLANRLLTRALNADQPGCMMVLSQNSDAYRHAGNPSLGVDNPVGTETSAGRLAQAPISIIHNAQP